MTDAPVVIAGGGPVGLTLALNLAHHGVRSILLERNFGTTRHPKMDITNGRSMELYRRLCLAPTLRAAGVPEGNSMDVLWATSPSGHLLHRFQYASARVARERADQANDGSGTAEPGMRISQIILEPVLKAKIDENPLVDVRFGWALESMTQDDRGVTVAIGRVDTAERAEVRGDYLVGCDGGGSRVRRLLGIALEGEQNLARLYMIHFNSSARDILNPWGVAWHLQTGRGSLVAQDDIDTWTLQTPLPPGFDESKLDPEEILRQFVGREFPFRILVANPWSPHLVIAERYFDRRVILAGDAVHQVIPTGGYGMNTGVGDAFDLGWKLAAIVNGWGGRSLLDSYEHERRQVALRNRAASIRHFGVRLKIAEHYQKAEAEGPLDDDGEDGSLRRAVLGSAIEALGNAENESWGIEHGYRYENSPIIAEDQGAPPAFDPLVSTPSTWPGSRLPHIRLSDGSSLYDYLGPEFTLLSIGSIDIQPFVDAAARQGVPLKIARIANETVLKMLERSLLLIRPDDHVAWRGDHAPGDIDALLQRVTGQDEVGVVYSS